MKNFLKATIDRFEDKFAVLILETREKILWPKDKLPPKIKEGEEVVLQILKNKDLNKKQKELAKAILEEIINE